MLSWRPDALAQNPRKLLLERREAVVLVLYLAIVAFAVFHYQQSLDEGREWVISRDFSVPRLLGHVLRYEGHPPLVYLLLWLPAHLHMPFSWINGLSAIVGAVSTYFLLRLSPFPFYLRALLPFTFALAYQESVVARSYVLFPLLGFLAAHLYRSRIPRPLTMAIVLALLANVSFHGTLVATGLAIAYAVQLLRKRGVVRVERVWLPTVIFITALVLVAACIRPPKYSEMTIRQAASRILHRIQGAQATSPTAHDSAAPSLPQPPVPDTRGQNPTPLNLTFVYPISRFALLAYTFELFVLVYLCTRREWMLLLPFALLAYFFLVGFVALRHTPLVWITLLILLWAAWGEPPRKGQVSLQTVVAIYLAALSILQIPWTFSALRYGMHHATYPAREAAAYVEALAPGTRMDGDKSLYFLTPYIAGYTPPDRANGSFRSHGSYANYVSLDELLRLAPNILILNETLQIPNSGAQLHSAGYSEIHLFCGGPYFPNMKIETTCLHVFSKKEQKKFQAQ